MGTVQNELKKIVDKRLNRDRSKIESVLQQDKVEGIDTILSKNYLLALDSYKRKLNDIYKSKYHLIKDENFLYSFLPSILHMHCIRCFKSYPRQNELFIYYGLFNYYTKCFYINKKELHQSLKT